MMKKYAFTFVILAVFLASIFSVWAQEDVSKPREALQEKRQELRQETQEKKQEVREDAREKKQELRGEVREKKQELRQEIREKKREIKQEVRQEAKAKFQEARQNFQAKKQELRQSRQEKLAQLKQIKKEERLLIMKEHLVKTADILINIANQVKAKAEESEKLTEEEASKIIAEMDDRIAKIEGAKSDIQAATTLEQLKGAAQYLHRNIGDIKKNLRAHIARIGTAQPSEPTPPEETTTTLGGAQ